jgi:cardiolipin synthase
MAAPTSWKFYLSPDTVWEGMTQACEQARFSIDCEQYIFEDDFLGKRFLELFAEKARKGIRVRLLVDAVGSSGLSGSKELVKAVNAGVKVQFFNPIRPWWVHQLLDRFLRTHRKLLIIDGEVGFIGGTGIRADASGRRDTNVRICGPVVDEFIAAFEQMWVKTLANKHIFGFKKPFVQDSDFALLTNSPYFRQRFTYWALVERIRAAKKYIYLTTPYFVPDRRLSRALRGAARRGVEVRLVVPNKSDFKITDLATRSYFGLALRAGVRIFKYQPSFIHAKTFVIDDVWASVGSSNLDSLSLMFNYEADLASTDNKFIEEIKWHFIEDSKQCREVLLREWRKRSIWQRLGELLTMPIHRLL